MSAAKDAYEARKAERQKIRDAKAVLDDDDTNTQLLDILDRLATSLERIADTMEQPS